MCVWRGGGCGFISAGRVPLTSLLVSAQFAHWRSLMHPVQQHHSIVDVPGYSDDFARRLIQVSWRHNLTVFIQQDCTYRILSL